MRRQGPRYSGQGTSVIAVQSRRDQFHHHRLAGALSRDHLPELCGSLYWNR